MSWPDLMIEQQKPLDYKMRIAERVIRESFSVSRHRVALAFSAGKDSTMLADFIRRFCPNLWERLHLIYGDTGVEYPECRSFWGQIIKEWKLLDRAHVARPMRTIRPELKYESQRSVWEQAIRSGQIQSILKPDGKLKRTQSIENMADAMGFQKSQLKYWPEGTRQGFWWCVDQYGWPLLGKDYSKLMARRINIDTFLSFSKSISDNPKLLAYYHVLRKVKISQACCLFLKKEPSRRIQRKLDVDVIIKGLLASESRPRAKNFLARGYLFEGHKQTYLEGDPFFHSQPFAIWTDDDIWEYQRRYNVPYSSLYDMGYRDRNGQYHKIKRNGCLWCGTDLKYPDNHMSMLRRTHPKAWWIAMNGGMADEIAKLQRMRRSKGQMALYDAMDPMTVLEIRPCYYDSLSRVVLCDETGSNAGMDEYDPEAIEDTG